MSKPAAQQRTALKALTRLTRAQAMLTAAIEQALKVANLPGLAHHDVLAVLAEAPELRLRPSEIGAAVVMAQYNLSRLIDRLVAAKYASRVAVDGDARGQWVVMTLDGAVIHRQMADVVAQTAQGRFDAAMDGDQLRKLSKMLRRLAPEAANAGDASH